jgi:hypothetical protein
MQQAASSTTRDELLAYAAEQGFSVSAAQFKRWRMAELLPPPMEFKGAGQGRGRQAARYPVQAGPQLVAVVNALDNDRDVDVAAWRLWWEGYAIPESRVWPLLDGAVARLDQTRQVLETVLDDDDASARFDAALTKRSIGKVMASARRRLGKSRFVGFVLSLYQLISGMPNYDEDDAKLLAHGFGVPPSEFVTPATFNIVRKIVEVDELRSALAQSVPGDLAQARDELRLVWAWLGTLFVESPQPSTISELGRAADLLRPALAEPPFEEVLLLWLRVRRHWLFSLWFPYFAARFSQPFAEWENDRPPAALPPRIA